MKVDICEIPREALDAILPKETLVICIINGIPVPFALFLNISIILNIVLRRRLRVLKSAFTLNVCVVNLFLTLTARLPFTINLILLNRSICKMGLFVGQTTVALSLLALFFLSLERYVVIFYPYRYLYFLTKRNIALAIVLNWLLPMATGSTIFIPGVHFKQVFGVLAALNIAIIASLIAMHGHTMYTLVKINKEITSAASRFIANMDCRCLIRRSKGVRFLTMAMIIVFACYFPLSLMKILRKGHFNTMWFRFHFLSSTFAVLPDILNPICILYSSYEVRLLVMKLPWSQK